MKMDSPKVSVIVPVYNAEIYLRKCLDSLLHQTLQELEIVVINDGSVDNSPEILREYVEEYPDRFLYREQKNSGQAAARNRALSLCRGEYVGFLDADDFVRETMFERMYEKARETDADYVACGYTDLTYEGEREIELQYYVASRVAETAGDMFFGALASPFLHLYRRSVLVESGVRFPEGVIYEDTAFYLNLIPFLKKLAVIEEPLAYRVRHSNSTTTTFQAAKVAQIFPVLEESLRFYREQGFYEQYREELEYFCVRILLCSSMQRIGRVEKREERKRLVEQTLDFIGKNFPQYRKNPCFARGGKNLYMKCFQRKTAGLFAGLIHVKGKFERKYS